MNIRKKIDFTTWHMMLTYNRNQNAPKEIFAKLYAKNELNWKVCCQYLQLNIGQICTT